MKTGRNLQRNKCTHRFVSELFDSAVKEGRLSHRGRDISGHVELEVGIAADAAVHETLVQIRVHPTCNKRTHTC